MNIKGWFPLGWSGLISLLPKGFSRVFSSTRVQKHQFFGTQPFLLSSSPGVRSEVMGLDAMIFIFWMLSFKPRFFSLSFFTFIKRVFNSSLLSCRARDQPARRTIYKPFRKLLDFWFCRTPYAMLLWLTYGCCRLVMEQSPSLSLCSLHSALLPFCIPPTTTPSNSLPFFPFIFLP